MASLQSIVQCLGTSSNSCGYCNGRRSSRSYGVWAYRLSVEDYQNMLNAGWRRSGNYLYRPDLAASCCPAHTIRLNTDLFEPSTSQKRVLKKLRKYLAHSTSKSADEATTSSVHEDNDSLSPQDSVPEFSMSTIGITHQGLERGTGSLHSDPSSPSKAVPDQLAFDSDSGVSGQKSISSETRTASSSSQDTRSESHLYKKMQVTETHIVGAQETARAPSEPVNASKLEDSGQYANALFGSKTLASVPSMLSKDVSMNVTEETLAGGVETGLASSSDSVINPFVAGSQSPKRKALSSSGLHLEDLRKSILLILHKALSELKSVDSTGELQFTPSVLESAMSKTTVNVRRHQGSKKARKGSSAPKDNNSSREHKLPSNGSFAETDEPHFSSNVALVLAAAERKSAIHSELGSAPSSLSKSDSGGKRRKLPADVSRQMDLAQHLVRMIERLQANSDIMIHKAEAASPGFINIWVSDTVISSVVDSGRRHLSRELKHYSAPRQQKSFTSQGLKEEHGGTSVSHLETRSKNAHSIVEPEFSPVPGAQGIDESWFDFTMELVPSRFDSESFHIYQRYQIAIHKEKPSDCRENSYRRFLVDSPLISSESNEDPETTYGSFHMLYRVNGRLFAVGVLDILPLCLSSVYLFYDPDFAMLSPGVLSALKEIEWVQKIRHKIPALRYYYMGYYIHTCKKMSYKARYSPSEILCHETRRWVAVEEAVARLDSSNGRATRLAAPHVQPGPDMSDFALSDEEAAKEAESALILVEGNRVIRLGHLMKHVRSRVRSRLQGLHHLISKFVLLVGRTQSKPFIHEA